MQPLVTPAQMRQVDAEITEPIEQVIDRVGALIAIAAIDQMGGSYGRRVVVIAGPGNNGADGRAAAHHLNRRGVAVRIVDVDRNKTVDIIARGHGLDLVIDAAYGTGLRGEYRAPTLPPGVPVLAVDIPSGYSGETGESLGAPIAADRTLVLAGYKVGQVFEPARSASGDMSVVDIGVPVTGVDPVGFLIEPDDVAAWLPERPVSAHKWNSACWVIGGSPGMRGAADLAARGALRAGSGLVRLGVLGDEPWAGTAPEIVTEVMAPDLAAPDLERFASLVIGPGLGRSVDTTTPLTDLIRWSSGPLVLDADALWHVAEYLKSHDASFFADRDGPVVLTPHDAEFARLAGEAPTADRLGSAAGLAERLGVIVLLKGPSTVIAEPGRAPLVSTAGDQRLATAGSGDVLAGVIGALAAQGVELGRAAATAAFVHGYAATLRPTITAGDLPQLVAQTIAELKAST